MGRGTSAMIETLYRLAQEHGVEIVERSHGQFQIKGHLTVNYFPFSAHRLAHVSGTTGAGKRGVDPLAAVLMAVSLPEPVEKPVKRRNSRAKRRRLIKAGMTVCRWCDDPLTLDNSTLEHVIPLHRGGSDRPHNWALACQPCNEKRGDQMPELQGWNPKPKPEPEPVLAAIDLSGLCLADQKLFLDLRRAQLNANYAKMEADYRGSAADCRQELRDKKMLLGAEIQMVKAELAAVNLKLNAATHTLYQSTFKQVAKRHLSPELFEKFEQEANRLYEAIPEEERLYVL